MIKNNFLISRLKSLCYAFKGIWSLLKKETNFQIQAIIAVIITITGFYFEISPIEWMIQTLTLALVMGAEGFNTALEKMVDSIYPNYHLEIGYIKDIAAAAVLITAIAALIIGCIIYIPKL